MTPAQKSPSPAAVNRWPVEQKLQRLKEVSPRTVRALDVVMGGILERLIAGDKAIKKGGAR